MGSWYRNVNIFVIPGLIFLFAELTRAVRKFLVLHSPYIQFNRSTRCNHTIYCKTYIAASKKGRKDRPKKEKNASRRGGKPKETITRKCLFDVQNNCCLPISTPMTHRGSCLGIYTQYTLTDTPCMAYGDWMRAIRRGGTL